MCKAPGFSIRVFMPSGAPEGLRIVEKSNWNGQGVVFPRSFFSEVKKRPELDRTGVYILWGPGESEHLPRAYVGESSRLVNRLTTQAQKKDFWTHGVAFTSKDQNLNKAHARYLEARLVCIASAAKRCELDNAIDPQSPALAEADEADAKLYLGDMLLCLPVIGVGFFEKPRGQAATSVSLFLKGKGIEARGYEESGGFVVLANSRAVKAEAPAIPLMSASLRNVLVKNGIFAEEEDAYRLTQDYLFNSPSQAASVMLGNAINGRLAWKDDQGRSLKEIQESETEPAPTRSHTVKGCSCDGG